ncbi:Os06g0495100 [Oryza sativa Japonica Group]|uniref:Protein DETOXIFICATION n=1 Tax=Oryza sativa subsp. japonica TaxID=39947 RepID=Q0DC20_ORYSJ|nr:Os06g0495100 [Oryza sativa Japonica Group]|eukprot:NP_001057689.1 Os06g0495100 [Oryza sativa Japonica Group]
MASALDTLCGQAFGAQQYHLLGIYKQRAMLLLTAVSVPLAVVWFYTGDILRLFGQEADIAAEAGTYARWMIPALFAYGLLHCQIRFLQTQNVVLPVMAAAGATALCHLLVCWVLVYAAGMGNRGAALSNAVSYWINVAILAVYVRVSSSCKKTWTGFSTEAFRDALGFFRLAVPSALMVWSSSQPKAADVRAINQPQHCFLGVDDPLWPRLCHKSKQEIERDGRWTPILRRPKGSGWIGAAIAIITTGNHRLVTATISTTHAIFTIRGDENIGGFTWQLGVIFDKYGERFINRDNHHEVFILGVQTFEHVVGRLIEVSVELAITFNRRTRVSNELGAGRPHAACLAVRVSVFMAISEGLVIGLVLISVRNIWGHAYSNEEEVVKYVGKVLLVISVSNFFDGIQCVLSGVARGCGWQKIGACVNLGAYYIVGIPSAYLIAFILHLSGMGLWLGITCGILVQVVLLMAFTLCTNWDKEAANAKHRALNSSLPSDTAT